MKGILIAAAIVISLGVILVLAFSYLSDENLEVIKNLGATAENADENYENPDEALANKLDESPDADFAGSSGDDAGSGGVGSAGGAGSSGNSGAQDGGCSEIQISYALKNKIENENCIVYENGACVEKNLECSIEVENLDAEAGGAFGIVFRFIDGNFNILASESTSVSVAAGNSEIVGISHLFYGAEAAGGISCDANTETVPSVTVC